MAFDIDSIRKYTKSTEEFNTADRLVEEDNVRLMSNSSFFKGEASVSGIVCEEGNNVNASFTLKEDKLVSYGCNCEYFKNNRVMCRHIAAVGMKYIYSRQASSEKIVYTSTEAKKILNGYLKNSISKNINKTASELKLRLVISTEYNYLKLKIYVSNGRYKYMVKDLYEFYRMFENNEIFTYASGTSVLHNIESFATDYRGILEFILNKIKEAVLLSQNSAFNRHSIIDKKYMLISGNDIDKLINMLYEGGISPELDNGKACEIICENPKIVLDVSKLGLNGYKCVLKGVDSYIEGYKRLFPIYDNRIYITDDDFYDRMKYFLENIIVSLERNTIIISRKDMPVFCNAVLGKIYEYVIIEGESAEIKNYAPWDFHCVFNFDIRGNKLVCKVKTFYENIEFDLFKKAVLPEGVCRDYEKEYALIKLINTFFVDSVNDNGFVATDDKEIYEVLLYGLKQFEEFGEVYISEELRRFKLVESVQINANVSLEGGMLHIDIDTSDFSRRELERVLNAYKEKRSFIKVDKNKLVRLDDKGIALLAEMANDLDFTAGDIVDNNIFIPKYRALYIDSRLRDRELTNYNRDSGFKSLVRMIKQVEDSDFQPTKDIAGTLRPYQKTGFRWLKTLDICGFGGILADDMGMGKSIQIISLLLDEKENGTSDRKTSLILAPSSILYNWENEIKMFGGGLKYVLVIGNKQQRISILKNAQDYDVLITSYEMLKRDLDIYKEIKFRFQIIDEAQNIKNHTTDNARSVKRINAETRFALTGTPIENRLSELWSIFDYLMPGFLYSYSKFKEKFENPIMKENRSEELKGLNRLIAPFILRRLKKDVLKELPDKIESNVYTKMEGEQLKLYKALCLRLKENLENDGFYGEKMRVLAELMKLRQVCCEPALCFEDYRGESAKLETCIELIRNGVAGNHKILLFSQFTAMFPYIRERLSMENITFYELTGSTSKEKRNFLVNSFNKDKTNVFLISLKAGGTGLNLTGADMVIHYDPWWNMAAQNQATDRAYRIGQTRDVLVFKLIMKDTIEEKILSLQSFKERLSDDILKNSDVSLSSLSKSELLSILE